MLMYGTRKCTCQVLAREQHVREHSFSHSEKTAAGLYKAEALLSTIPTTECRYDFYIASSAVGSLNRARRDFVAGAVLGLFSTSV